MDDGDIAERVLAGDRAALARAITLVESGRADRQERGLQLLDRCLQHTGNSIRCGITGVPGAGKSTFIEALGLHVLDTDEEARIAVLAIDPSSPVSGGSILGDKTRMPRLSAHERAFIRPSPAGDTPGGVAARTREAILLCEAAGFNRIFVETIGVGQSEVAVASVVDFFLLLMLAGAGDELQGMKRGVLELADLVAFNKADGANRERAEAARKQLEGALSLFASHPDVVTCSARTGDGIAHIWSLAQDIVAREDIQAKRSAQAALAFERELERTLRTRFLANDSTRALMASLEQEVRAFKISPAQAARRVFQIDA